MYKVRLRGELCIGIGSLLSLAAFILLIFVHVGSTSTSSTPRGIAMARMNVSNYGAALAIGIAPDPVDNLYALNASAPLARAQGIRTTYNFGLYTYCGILTRPNTTNLPISNVSTIPLPDTGVGMCGNTSAAFRFAPYDVLVADMSGPFPVLTDSLVNATLPFRDSKSLGGQTRSAYYLIIIGTVLCFLSLILGLIKRTSTFLISAFLATLSAIFTLAAACLWLSAIHAAQSVNSLVLGGTTPLGIVVSSGEGLTLLWAAFGCLVAALVPYWISSCTFRG